MSKGLDYAWTHPPAAAVKAAGFAFAARYLSRDHSKNLTRGEADLLLREGISLVVVWESGAKDALRGFGGGKADAIEARAQANACGLTSAVIYFAVDYDAPPRDQAAINGYLDGAADVLGRARTGVYGGYWPLSRARAADKAAYFWGTVAWSGREWDPAANPHTFTPDIMQGAQIRVAGVSVDVDESHGREHTGRHGDFGQWPRPAVTALDSLPDSPAPWVVPAVRVSLRQAAHGHGVHVDQVIYETARQQARAFGDRQSRYVTAGNWDAPLEHGTYWYLPRPGGGK